MLKVFSRPQANDLRRAARAAFEADDGAKLDAACQALLARHPEDSEARRLLGRAALRDFRPDLAVTWLREAAARRPDSPGPWTDLARALKALNRAGEAEAILSAADARGVRSAPLLSQLGYLRADLERFEDAKAAFEGAIDIDPVRGDAYRGLALAGGLNAADPLRVQAERVVAKMRMEPSQAALVHHALAEAALRDGDFYEFLRRLADANTASAAAWGRAADPLEALEKRDLRLLRRRAPKLAVDDEVVPRPLFLIGGGCAGQPLVEAALAAAGLAESKRAFGAFGGPVARHVESVTRAEFPEEFERLDAAARRAAAQAYRDRAGAASDARVVVDRAPECDAAIGAAAHLFPDAVFVRLRRDPLDQGLAIYRRPFRTSPGRVTDLKAIGRWTVLRAKRDARIDRCLGDRLIDVRAEALVQDPAAATARIAAALGLTLDAVAAQSVGRARAPFGEDDPNAAPPLEIVESAGELEPLARACRKTRDAYGADAG